MMNYYRFNNTTIHINFGGIIMSDNKKIKLYVITGFLGAGKTSLIKNLLNNYSGLKTGVIINEFGEISIDGTLIKEEGYEIMEINNGSIFCKCLEGSFIDSVVKFSKFSLDYLFVESSGLSDPSSMESIMQQVNRIVPDRFEFMGMICVVSAVDFIKLIKSFETYRKQINYSNCVIINKIDLVNDEKLENVREEIAAINPMANIVETSYGKIDEHFFDKINTDFSYPAPLPSINCPANKPQIFVLRREEPIEKQLLVEFLEGIAKYSLRIKGFALTKNGMYHVDVVQDDINYNPTSIIRQKTELVIVPKENDDFNEVIEKFWVRS